jgi:uncharacterized RDD family membrane protein YckC
MATSPIPGPSRRVIARLIDGLLAGTAGVLLAVLWIDWAVDTSDSDWGVISLLVLSAAIFVATVGIYEIVFVAWRGQTPGKMIARLRVVRWGTGAGVGPIRAGVRLLPLATAVIPVFGYLVALVAYGSLFFDENGRGWHDRLAGTVVVMVPRRAA